MNLFALLTEYLKEYPWRLCTAILLGFATILAGIGLLASSGYLVSAAALRPPILDLLLVIVAVRFFGISRGVLRYGERLLSHDITFRQLMSLRSTFFQVLGMTPASRLMGYRSSSLLTSVTSDIEELQHFTIRVFIPVTAALLVIIFTYFFLNSRSPFIAQITLFSLVVSGTLLPILIRKLAAGYGVAKVNLRTQLHELWITQVQGAEEIRLFENQARYRENNASLSRKIREVELRQSRISGMNDAIFLWIMYGTVGTGLWVAAPEVLRGDLPGVMLALMLFSIMASFEATQNLGTAFQYLESVEKAAANISEITGIRTETDQHIAAISHSEEGKNMRPEFLSSPMISSAPCSVGFHRVCFGYDTHPVLQDLTFQIERGKRFAVTGPSGSGKSTLLNLLLKFYAPAQGKICLDNRDLKLFDGDEVRAMLSVVDQSTYLFNDTLRNNLLLGSPDAGDPLLESVLEQSGLQNWYTGLNQGLDTLIGEHGKNLSGGERQRVAVARALLKNKGLWILDEPSANLDPLAERALILTLHKVTRNKTVLWITHRLVDMDEFDCILVLDSGKIVEAGNHRELLEREGWYARMYSLQQDILNTGWA